MSVKVVTARRAIFWTERRSYGQHAVCRTVAIASSSRSANIHKSFAAQAARHLPLVTCGSTPEARLGPCPQTLHFLGQDKATKPTPPRDKL
ncbi:hypothetical protein BST61_g110 [Cercospora zeina]